MPEILLTGLVGSRPLGALAAFGLLRIVSRLEEFENPRLSWRFADDWIAVFYADGLQNGTDLRRVLIQALLDHQQGRAQADYLTWNDDIKVAPEQWAALLRDKASHCRPNSCQTVDFLAAFGSEMVLARSKKEVKPTAFHMTAGQQTFLKSARNPSLLSRSRTYYDARRSSQCGEGEIAEAFERTLFGPWLYRDRFHSAWLGPSERSFVRAAGECTGP